MTLEGDLNLPEGAQAIVLFAHGSGRHSSRNRYVARVLNEAKLATLLLDLLTAEEEAIDLPTAHLRFNIGLLGARLIGATDWLTQYVATRRLPIGYPRQHWRCRGAGGGSRASVERGWLERRAPRSCLPGPAARAGDRC